MVKTCPFQWGTFDYSLTTWEENCSETALEERAAEAVAEAEREAEAIKLAEDAIAAMAILEEKAAKDALDCPGWIEMCTAYKNGKPLVCEEQNS